MKVSKTLRGVAFAIWKVWTLDGEGKAFLKTESALVQVHRSKKPVVTGFFSSPQNGRNVQVKVFFNLNCPD